MGQIEKAYELFRRAAAIDLGPFMGSSDMGIHAASFGGIWQCVVYGFGGVRMLGGKLRINPCLPEKWEKLSFTLMWKGQKLEVIASRNQVKVTNLTGREPISVEICGEEKLVADVCITEN